jgi:uncharacterized protein (DUF1501 family)
MDLHNSSAFTRRQFLHTGLTLASAVATVPWFLNASALGMPAPGPGLGSIPGVPEDHILVVVQLSGGNDGLNTVVPYGIDAYYKARPGIAVPAAQALRLGNAEVGLHPQMTGIKELYDQGLAAVVQGVGYPNPNRSHFKSMDIWQTADTTATGDGWLGRYFDSECCGYGKGESGRPEAAKGEDAKAGPPGIAIGRSAPLAMEGRTIKPVSFETEDLFRWIGQDVHPSLVSPYDKIQRRGAAEEAADTNAAFLMRTALDAQISSDLIRKAVRLRPGVQYPNSELARQLSMVACMIRAGLPTRVYYVQHGGFDTHSGQGGAQGRHGNLLNQFAAAVQAFYKDLKTSESDGRVLTMSFSEFGRRVGQNASQGTDHGTAAPMFLFGPMVKAGVIGDHPSLTDLDEGDLKFKIDFRTVYAGILEGWLKADSKKILEGEYKPVPVVKKA